MLGENINIIKNSTEILLQVNLDFALKENTDTTKYMNMTRDEFQQ
jgi:hypothetical protein